ncbi:MAG TPA: acetylglutamate kinase [Micavibrio sp.]|nr:acetylglutamate kinase [Micavibrio sp.]
MNIQTDGSDPFSDILKYRDKYKGQWIIIKYGGALAANDKLVYNIGVQCAFLKTAIGAKVIIVHGGGEQTSKALSEQGISSTFDAATRRRLTDEITLKIFDETLRKLNKQNVQTMQTASQDVYFQGMAGYDLDTVTAKSIGEFTGKAVGANMRFFEHMQDNCIPVFYTACQNISPKNSEHRLNVNADEFAGFLGENLKAIRLAMLTDKNGVLDKDSNKIPSLSTAEVEELINNGTVTGGMITKLRAAAECANQMTSGGVVILNGNDKFSILKEILYEKGEGTLMRSPARITASEQFNTGSPSKAIPETYPAPQPLAMR